MRCIHQSLTMDLKLVLCVYLVQIASQLDCRAPQTSDELTRDLTDLIMPMLDRNSHEGEAFPKDHQIRKVLKIIPYDLSKESNGFKSGKKSHQKKGEEGKTVAIILATKMDDDQLKEKYNSESADHSEVIRSHKGDEVEKLALKDALASSSEKKLSESESLDSDISGKSAHSSSTEEDDKVAVSRGHIKSHEHILDDRTTETGISDSSVIEKSDTSEKSKEEKSEDVSLSSSSWSDKVLHFHNNLPFVEDVSTIEDISVDKSTSSSIELENHSSVIALEPKLAEIDSSEDLKVDLDHDEKADSSEDKGKNNSAKYPHKTYNLSFIFNR